MFILLCKFRPVGTQIHRKQQILMFTIFMIYFTVSFALWSPCLNGFTSFHSSKTCQVNVFLRTFKNSTGWPKWYRYRYLSLALETYLFIEKEISKEKDLSIYIYIYSSIHDNYYAPASHYNPGLEKWKTWIDGVTYTKETGKEKTNPPHSLSSKSHSASKMLRSWLWKGQSTRVFLCKCTLLH